MVVRPLRTMVPTGGPTDPGGAAMLPAGDLPADLLPAGPAVLPARNRGPLRAGDAGSARGAGAGIDVATAASAGTDRSVAAVGMRFDTPNQRLWRGERRPSCSQIWVLI